MLPELPKPKGIVLNLLFPQWCVYCGKECSFLCQSCRQLLPRIIPPLCPEFGGPQLSSALCPSYIGWQAIIDSIRSPFRFDVIICLVIYQLKYRNLRALVVPLAWLLIDYLSTIHIPAEVLVPVLLHSKRLGERGYYQSNMLAQELGKISRLAVVDNCLIQQRRESPQVRTPTVDERRSNVADAFTRLDHRLQGKKVLLIDDVSTSGATPDAYATVPKPTGATSVWGLVLVREI